MSRPPVLYTRREFGKLTLAGLPLSFAFQAIDSKKCYQFCRDALA